MENQFRRARSLELVTVNAAEAILSVDRRVFGYKPGFVSQNLLSCYLATNTWLLMIREFCGDIWYDVRETLLAKGLVNVVLRFADAADRLVACEAVDDELVKEVLSSVSFTERSFRVTTLGYRPGALAVQLQICRYLKRMSLLRRTDVEESALNGFHETQLGLRQSVIPGYVANVDLINGLRLVLKDSIDWGCLVGRLSLMGPTSRTFTTGAAADAGTEFGAKLRAMAESNPGFFRPIFGNFISVPSQTRWPEVTTEAEFTDLLGTDAFPWKDYAHAHSVIMATAVKNMKGPRVIAKEPVDRQTAERYAKDILYCYTPDGITLNDQTPNQELAVEGARSGRYATIDLSSASDYVTKRLVLEIFPEDFTRAIWPMVPSHYILNDQRHPLYSFATMGNGLTFWVESMTFWAIATLWAGKGNARVYGDDIIVPTPVASAVIESLESLGFIVNRSKTFTSGRFRESCGVEAYHEEMVSSSYYPRSEIRGDITEHTCTFKSWTDHDSGDWCDSTMRVVALQQKLSNWCPSAARFLSSVLKDAHPSMTTSRWGSVSPDIWGPGTLSGPDVYPPAAVVQHAERASEASDTENTALDKPALKPVAEGSLPDAVLRATWYGPRVKSREEPDDEYTAGLLAHYLYGRFQDHGIRQWREGDGWLPYNCFLPDEEAERLRAKVVEWGLREK